MATSYTFTVHAGVGTIQDAAVTVGGIRYDVDQMLATGYGGGTAGTSFVVVDDQVAAAITALRAGTWPLFDVNSVPGASPTPIPSTQLMRVAGTPTTTGQGAFYDSSLGLYVVGTPAVSSQEITYAENVTGTVTTASVAGGGSGAAGTIVDIPNCAISVPAQTGTVMIEGGAEFQQSVAGGGNVFLYITETTAGAGSPTVGWDARPLPNSTSNFLKNIGYLRAYARLTSVASTRTFKLSFYLTAPASNSPSVVALNTNVGLSTPSYLQARLI